MPKTDNKIEEIKKISKRLNGTGIIYVRNRRRTAELAHELSREGISTTIYHAGLSSADRAKHQEDWKNNKVRMIVATNAFGMGIDKPDVRFVIHYDLPNSPEAYYQEAGRGGRDGKLAYAIIVYSESDIDELKYFQNITFPEKDLIRKIYLSLGNFFKLAVGAGQGESFAFDIQQFCKTYPYKPIEVISALKIIELDGYLEMSEAVFAPSRVKIEINNFELYNFQVKNQVYEPITKLLLRKYPGMFDEFVRVSEAELATSLNLSINKVKGMLNELTKMEIVKYIEQSELPFITYTLARQQERDFRISKEAYEIRKKNSVDRNGAIINYLNDDEHCRSTLLLNYFEEYPKHRCGKCDNCIQINKLEISNIEFEQLSKTISEELKKGPISIQELQEKVDLNEHKNLIKVINWLVENEKLQLEGNTLRLN